MVTIRYQIELLNAAPKPILEVRVTWRVERSVTVEHDVGAKPGRRIAGELMVTPQWRHAVGLVGETERDTKRVVRRDWYNVLMQKVTEKRTWLLGLATGVTGCVCLVQFALGLLAEDRIVSRDLQRLWAESRGAQPCPLWQRPTADNEGRGLFLEGRIGRSSMPRLVASVVGECRWGVGCAAGNDSRANIHSMNAHVQMGESDPWQRVPRPSSADEELTP